MGAMQGPLVGVCFIQNFTVNVFAIYITRLHCTKIYHIPNLTPPSPYVTMHFT